MKTDDKIQQLKAQKEYNIHDLMDIVTILRGEGGCPWDREQTHQSIRNDLIEETYEVIEAIDTDNSTLMREELGDLLFQIIFHANMEEEKNNFTLGDIITEISAKMIHRHPHVFGNVVVEGTGEVLSNWESIKTEEKQRKSLSQKLHAIPPMLPALMRAQKFAKKSGIYDQTTEPELLDQIRKTLSEMQDEKNPDALSRKLGAVLMDMTAFAQKKGIQAEQSLYESINSAIDDIKN